MVRWIVASVVLLGVLVHADASPDSALAAEAFEVLVFHETQGFRHPSIVDGVVAIREIGASEGFSVRDTDDSSIFTSADLSELDVVVFLSTTRDVLDPSEEAALEAFIEGGGGFVGIHAAADTEYDWSWYESLVGAYFDGHPAPQTATVDVVAPDHPIMDGIPLSFERFDEWYNYRTVPGPGVTVLATLDESSYSGGTMGDPHPIMWAHDVLGGRSFYTGFGHTKESFSEPIVRTVLTNGIRWVAGIDHGDRFDDDEGSIFEADIEWLASEGITQGCNPPLGTMFCPTDPVTRGQFAAFLNRALDLPDGLPDPFVDDDSSVFEEDIERLAAAGVARGCNPPDNTMFCPTDALTRGQMAALLARALELGDGERVDYFDDDNGSIFERDIDRLAAAGITAGCNPPLNTMFCPNDTVTRGQMAALLRRALT